MSITSTTPGASLTAAVAEEVRSWMGRRRITGARMARELGVSQMWVSDRLAGKTPFTVTDLDRIASVLDVPVVQLFPADLRNQVRVAYPLGAGPGPKPITRGVPSPGRPRPPTFGQRSGGHKIDTRPPGHPGMPLRRAA